MSGMFQTRGAGGVDSLLAWLVIVAAAGFLGWVGYHFTIHTLRLVALGIAAVTVVLLARYGLTLSGAAPTNLAVAFTRGADDIGGVLVHPLLPGRRPLALGRIGWIVIIAALVIGYRQLEAWAQRWQAPVLDTSALRGDQHTSGQPPSGLTEVRRRLGAEVRFRLAAMEVRAPAILPGASRSMNALASIAESSGVSGSGFAGAIIRFLGILWPRPRRLQLRIWPEVPSGKDEGKARIRVTVLLEDPRTGDCVATKTLVADDLDDDDEETDDAATRIAGYVARHVFAQDPATPSWCYGAADGRDLATWLLARHERVFPRKEEVKKSRRAQIKILEEVAASSRCAGVVRYELAQLYDVTGDHVKALSMHAINREQYPRFYRGRYRLGISLRMVANQDYGPSSLPAGETEEDVKKTIEETLKILHRCGLTNTAGYQATYFERTEDKGTKIVKLAPWLREDLLDVAAKELCAVRRQLTLWRIIWATFRHRDERATRRPFWGRRARQEFQDGVRVAELAVAISQSQDFGAKHSTWHLRPALDIANAVAGNTDRLESALEGQTLPTATADQEKPWWKDKSASGKDSIRLLPIQRRTASWQAAYNTACLYAVLEQEDKALISLNRAISNRDSEMERPSDWISGDPDFARLSSEKECFKAFDTFLKGLEENDYPEKARGDLARTRS
jgi:hypothetical protein